jgi:hypothetical protein
MSGHKKVGGVDVFFIADEPSNVCEDCGKIDELRPYGKNGANVCFECAMKDEANAAAMFKKRIDGDS